MTNEAMVVEYLDWLKNTRGRAGVTYYNYAATLARLLEWCGTTALADVSLPTLESFVKRPRRGMAAGSAATQAKDVAVARACYRYLVDRGYMPKSPAALLCAPKINNANPRPIPDADWAKLWDEADPGPERIMLGLGALAGLRRREICELTPTQVFVTGQRLVNFTRKGGGDDVTPYGDLCRVVASELPPLSAAALAFPDELAAYRQRRKVKPYLLEWGEAVPAAARERTIHSIPDGMTDPNICNRRMRVICERAGVQAYTPHQLRHTFVTNLLRASVPLHLVQRMANHSSPDVTSRYIKAGASELREWMQANGTNRASR